MNQTITIQYQGLIWAPSILTKGKKSLSKSSKKKNIGKSVNMGDYIPDIKGIMNNTLALIIIVLLVSSFITYIISLFNKDTAVIGVSRILFSALLSYGLVLYSERDMNIVLTKGTIVFFASMIIYVILIPYNKIKKTLHSISTE